MNINYQITIELKGAMSFKDDVQIEQQKFKKLLKNHIEKSLGCRCSVSKCLIDYEKKEK